MNLPAYVFETADDYDCIFLLFWKAACIYYNVTQDLGYKCTVIPYYVNAIG